MTTNERTQTSIDTFITPATEAGCITLRPFSAGIRAREVMRRMEREPDVAAAKRECAPKPHMTPEAFATRLRSWRKARRLTQPRAAAAVSALGVVVGDGTWAKWAEWERCDQTPWPLPMRIVLAALARAPRPAPPAPTSRIRPHREMPMCRASSATC